MTTRVLRELPINMGSKRSVKMERKKINKKKKQHLLVVAKNGAKTNKVTIVGLFTFIRYQNIY